MTGPQDTNRFLADPILTGFMQRFHVSTMQFHLQDTLALLDNRLSINAGIKHPSVTIDTASINRERAAGTLVARENFLPQVGANFALNKNDELFASVARNLRAFEAGVYGQFSQSQAAFDATGAQLKPETSTSADVGLRFRRGGLSGSVALYKAAFRNRLLSVATCVGVVGCPNTVVNVGRVATQGIESAASWSVTPVLSWFNSVTVNQSRYRADYVDNGVLIAVSGKQVVDAPERLMQTELRYDNKHWFAKLGGKYTGRRFYTFSNDGAVPAYAVWDLSGGTRLGRLTLQAHVNNLFNKRYFGTIGSNQFAAADPDGTFPTMLTGSPRELFVTISGKLR